MDRIGKFEGGGCEKRGVRCLGKEVKDQIIYSSFHSIDMCLAAAVKSFHCIFFRKKKRKRKNDK